MFTLFYNFIFGIPAICLILWVGFFLTISLKFIQFFKFPFCMKMIMNSLLTTKSRKNSFTPFQSVCTALAATIGTGNIAGVAGAIALGGPGAVFWMWVSAFFGMCTKFSEIVLSVHFRCKLQNEYVGGPMYYIEYGLGWHWLAVLYSLIGTIAVFGTGNTAQANTIASAVSSLTFYISKNPDIDPQIVNIFTGSMLSISTALILIGGVKRIGKVSEKLVPFMAMFYIILSSGILILNRHLIPAAFLSIINGAFHPQAVTGGFVGSIFLSLKHGMAKGIFSNEAGLGTSSIAHASSSSVSPVEQGFLGIFEVFFDTMIICTMTALTILCSNVYIPYGKSAGLALTMQCFSKTYGPVIIFFFALSIICFAFSSMIGWGYYGIRFIEFLTQRFDGKIKKKILLLFLMFYAIAAIPGAVLHLDFVWNAAQFFNGLLVLPNLFAVFFLSDTVVSLTEKYFLS